MVRIFSYIILCISLHASINSWSKTSNSTRTFYLTGITYHSNMHSYLPDYIPNKLTADGKWTFHQNFSFQYDDHLHSTQTLVLFMRDTFNNPAGALMHGVFTPTRYGQFGILGGIYARKPFHETKIINSEQIMHITIHDFPVQIAINHDLEIMPVILGTYSYQFDNNLRISLGTVFVLTHFLIGFSF